MNSFVIFSSPSPSFTGSNNTKHKTKGNFSNSHEEEAPFHAKREGGTCLSQLRLLIIIQAKQTSKKTAPPAQTEGREPAFQLNQIKDESVVT